MALAAQKSDQLRIRLLEEELRIVKNELELAKIRISELTVIAKAAESLYFPHEWGLTDREANMLRYLFDVSAGTKEGIMFFLYGDSLSVPEPKIVDVYISKIRKKLAKYELPIVIETIWGQGYVLTKESKDYIRSKRLEVTNN